MFPCVLCFTPPSQVGIRLCFLAHLVQALTPQSVTVHAGCRGGSLVAVIQSLNVLKFHLGTYTHLIQTVKERGGNWKPYTQD